MLNFHCSINIADEKIFFSKCIASSAMKLGNYDRKNKFIEFIIYLSIYLSLVTRLILGKQAENSKTAYPYSANDIRKVPFYSDLYSFISTDHKFCRKNTQSENIRSIRTEMLTKRMNMYILSISTLSQLFMQCCYNQTKF